MMIRVSSGKKKFLVDLEKKKVFEDKDQAGKISKAGEVTGPRAQGPLKAARTLDQLFVDPYPGTKAPSTNYQSGGVVHARDVQRFEHGEEIPASLAPLEKHIYP